MFAKLSLTILGLTMLSTLIYAEEAVQLPTLKVLAETELQAETGFVPYQEQPVQQQALQQYLTQYEHDLQNTVVKPAPVTIEVMPRAAQAELDALPLVLQQYVQAIAQGLQSSDPTQGLYVMLQPYILTPQNAISADRGQLKIQLSEGQLKEAAFKQGQMLK